MRNVYHKKPASGAAKNFFSIIERGMQKAAISRESDLMTPPAGLAGVREKFQLLFGDFLLKTFRISLYCYWV